MKAIEKKRKRLQRRHFRLRKKVVGSPECPRLLVKKSLNHTYAQLIDDDSGKVLISANTRQTAIASGLSGTGNKAAAAAVGKTIGDAAIAQGIKQVCFDRAGRKYHGRVQAVADAAREAGLKF